ncbi:MAG: response regulator [Ignavibacteriae bacterium]|nr:response regulator [Ignavibacteriota bacterium]
MKHILLVEDESDLINIMDLVISDEGYRVTQMGSAEDALQFCKTSVPDLIISDIKMGAMDGLTMFERMRAMPKFEHVPFIIVSAFSDMQWKTKAKSLGAMDYFTKPFDVDEVVSAIKKVLTPLEKTQPFPSV